MTRELLLMVLILMILGSEVAATSNHSLEWGVEIGDEFVYVLQKKVVSDMIGQYMQNSTMFIDNIDEGQKVIARVDRLGEFPDEINSSRFLPDANCTLIRENDSEIIMENMSMIVVPIGDWEFLREISNYSSRPEEPGEQEGFEFELIDNDEEWGTRFSGSFLFAIFAITMNMTTIYEKANGTLKELQFRINVSGDDMLHIVFVKWHPGMETILPGELQLLTLFIFISMGGLIAIIILFMYKRRIGHLPFRGNKGESIVQNMVLRCYVPDIC